MNATPCPRHEECEPFARPNDESDAADGELLFGFSKLFPSDSAGGDLATIVRCLKELGGLMPSMVFIVSDSYCFVEARPVSEISEDELEEIVNAWNAR